MTDVDQEIDTFFEDETEEAEAEVEAEAKTEAETEESNTEEVTGEEESTPPVDKEPTLVPIAALHDERRKAQHLKEEVEKLRKQVPVQDEAPDPYEDIDAYNEYMRNKWEAEKAQEQERTRMENLNKSRSRMLEEKSDYLEMERIFEVMTASDPELIGKMLNSGDAAKFAYETAAEYKKSLLGETPKTEEPTNPEERDERLDVALKSPNLAKVTAQASNVPEAEQDEDLNDIFADVGY